MTNTTAEAAPALIFVTNTNDSGPGSLRQAIADASPGEQIVFNISGGGMIILESELVIDKSLIISGSRNVPISGDLQYRVFKIMSTAANPNVTVELRRLSIYNGFVSNTNDCGSILGYCGGGIMVLDSGVNLTLLESELNNNYAYGYGGGLANESGHVTIIDSTITGNIVRDFYGGGISNYTPNTGSMIIINSTISDNRADDEGGLVNNGGGIYSSGAPGGCNDTPTLMIENSTITDNTADNGGGLYIPNGVVTIDNSTITANTANNGAGIFANNDSTACMRIGHTIIAGNVGNDVGTIQTPTQRYDSQGYNLIGTAGFNVDFSQEFNAGGDQTNATADLGPLLDHGGWTWTHKPLPGSAAIDAGATSCAATDQRSVSRPQEGNCDIGAHERWLLEAAVVSGTDDVQFQWDDAGSGCGYELFESTSAYFTPTTANRIAQYAASGETATDRAGDPATNYFFINQIGCPGMAGYSQEVGVFDFGITPGD